MALIREETMWIAPFVFGSSIITILFIIFDKNCADKKKKILLYLIPICIYIIGVLGICTLNKIAYGEFVRIEQNSKPFKDFEKAISSVDVENPEITIPVPKEAREKLYEVSPAFSELKDTFDGNSGKNLSQYGRNPNEIEAGWLMWTIFAALNEHGYSQNLTTFNEYLERAANEINEAYEDGRLKKEDEPDTIFNKKNMTRLLNSFKEAFEFQTELKNVNIVFPEDTFFEGEHDPGIPEERKVEFEEVTGNQATNSLTYNYKVDKIKIKVLEFIKNVYTKINKPLFFISLAIFGIMLIRFFFIKPRFGNYKEIIVLASFLMLYFIRLLVIAYVDAAMFPAIVVLYLASAYGLQFGFEVLALVFGITGIINFFKNRKEKV